MSSGPQRFPVSGPLSAMELMEQQRHNLCVQLGIAYPTNYERVLSTLHFMKNEAEKTLKKNYLPVALALYTQCLQAVQLFHGDTLFQEELPKILCNRSLVLTKMRRFQEAEHDAMEALRLCPHYIKAYWRVSQAARGSHDGAKKALYYIVQGLGKALDPNGHGTPQDKIDFLAELCTLIPKTSVEDLGDYAYALRDSIAFIGPNLDVGLLEKVLQTLCKKNLWHGVAMLVTGYNRGPYSVLDGIANRVSCIGVNVGALLSSHTTPVDLNKWVEELAARLIQLGASVDEIGLNTKKPPIHLATEIALATKQTRLLKCVLDAYSNKEENKNVQNSAGSTALHLLVRSRQASQTHGLAILRLLLQYRLTTMITDRNGKVPLEYLKPIEDEEAYNLLKKGTQTVGELRQDLEVVKGRGNEALQADKLNDALEYYGEGLEISLQSKELYKEAAILYSNCAHVYHKLHKYEEALASSMAAINSDPSYGKGHWWTGKCLVAMETFDDAFVAYIEGCNKATITADVQINFILEAVKLLKHVSEEKFMTCYSQLHSLNSELWPQVLGKLSKACEWRVIAYLVLGPELDEIRIDNQVFVDTVDAFCKGVAKSVTLKEITLNTVLQYLHENNVNQCVNWLDALLCVVFMRGRRSDTYQTLAIDDRDRPLHATVMSSLITGRTFMLKEMLKYGGKMQNTIKDGWGSSVFHTVTRMSPLPPEKNMKNVIELLLEKGFSVMERDNSRKLPVDYLDKSYPRYLYEMFSKASGSNSLNDINQFKQEGNIFCNRGELIAAILAYTKAIVVLERHSPHNVNQGLSNRDVAELYGNRAEIFMNLGQSQEALEDASKSLSKDGHWYMNHTRVGRAKLCMKDHEGAMRAYIKAYKSQKSNDNIKTEIMWELCEICMKPDWPFDRKKKLPEFPSGQGHLWAQTAYQLIFNNLWDSAQVAYYQFLAEDRAKRTKRKTVTIQLEPICKLEKLKVYNWGTGLLQYFLECKANRHTITLGKGDSYLHAIVRIELVTADKTIKLLEYVLKEFCKGDNKDMYRCDTNGNTILHTATSEARRDINTDQRYKIIILLLNNGVDPNIKNMHGKLAIDCLPSSETQAREHLRMAMYGKGENLITSF